MKFTKTISLMLTVLLALMLAFAITSCNEEPAECAHVDAERDGVCDKCGKPSGVTPCEHTDENKDKKCDACGADYTAACTDHVSADADAKCDYCGADIVCTECVDSNSDGKCDKCGKAVEVAATGSVELVKDGEVKFQFVLANEYKGDMDVVRTLDTLISTINSKKASVERVADTAATEKEVEIIIGTPTNRGDACKIDGHTLGYNGYSISVVGTKVLVLAGSADALVDALGVLETDVLKITKKIKTLPDSTLTEKNSILEMPDKYNIDNVLVAGNDLGDYVIAVDFSLVYDTFRPKDSATAVQSLIYEKTGIWLPIVNIDAEYGKAIVFNVVAPELASTAGFKVDVKGGNINIECGFPNRLNDAVLGFVRSEITNKKQPTVSFNENFSTSINVREVKYNETFTVNGKLVGGAKGDGVNDDFFELRGVHLYANIWGHTVRATIGATYYIGFEFASERSYIPVKTNVNWTGAKFIFDDTVVPVEYHAHRDNYTTAGDAVSDGNCDICGIVSSDWQTKTCKQNSNGWHRLPIFYVYSDNVSDGTNYELLAEIDGEGYKVVENFAGKSLPKNSTNIGWEPGKKVLIKLYNDNVKHFIRFGGNANDGASQYEIILVHPNGDIDPTTPLHWDYDVITRSYMKPVEDTPITLEGGEFTTKANLGPNYYYSYGRNIRITRSNTTVKNVKHYFEESFADDVERCPYGGFTSTSFANNLTFENMLITHHKNRYDKGNGTLLGTYEIGVDSSNDLKWINVKQTNFFEADGSVSYKGLFGTNYCKNFYFEGCEITSMDAHSGLYNGKAINCTFEHMNFIGEGEIYLENITIYADANCAGVNFRPDYGSTWNGNVIIKGMDIRYSRSDININLFHAQYQDHWFGYTTYLPHTVELYDVKITKYKQTTDADGVRTETVIGTNLDPLYYVSGKSIYQYNSLQDISKLVSEGGAAQHNPYVGTKTLKINDCGNLKLVLPTSGQFKDLKYYVDGVLWEDWMLHQA